MRTWYMARREMIQLRRDRRTIIMFLTVPVVLVLMFGYALSFNIRHLATVILDEDRTSESRRLVERFLQSGQFDLAARVSTEREFHRALDYGKAKVGLRIPPFYARDLGSEREVPVQVIVDGSDPQAANAAVYYSQSILDNYARQVLFASLMRESGGAPPQVRPVDARIRVWYNPDLRDADFLIPGVVGVITSILTMNLSVFSIVREREQGTFEQLIVTPLRQVEIIFGKLIPYALIAGVNACLVIGTGHFLFGVPIRGNVTLLMALTLLFIMGSLGVGLFVSTITKTQSQVFPIIMANYLPNMLMSGFIFPIASMPKVMQPLTQVIPLTHYLVIVRGIMLKGMGIDAFAPQLAYLTFFCLGILTLSTLIFRKKLQ
jgi:drug efflux transport system permease protein